MKFLTILALIGTFQLAQAKLLNTTVIRGKVKSLEAKTVTVIDKYGQIHKVSRKEFNNEGQKLSLNEEVSFTKKLNVDNINNFDFRLQKGTKLDRLSRQKLLTASINFLMMVDEKNKNPKKRSVQNRLIDSLNRYVFGDLYELLFPTANAANARSRTAQGTCIHSGFPSVIHEGVCLHPWHENARSVSRYAGCGGGDNVYRCNPDIFGPGTSTGLQDRCYSGRTRNGDNCSGMPEGEANTSGAARAPYDYEKMGTPEANQYNVYPSKPESYGYCVQVGPTQNLIEACFHASRLNLSRLAEEMDLDHFNNKFVPLFQQYCSNNECSEAGQLRDVTGESPTCIAASACTGDNNKRPNGRFCIDDNHGLPAGIPDGGFGRDNAGGADNGRRAFTSATSGRFNECHFLHRQIRAINFHRNDEIPIRCQVKERAAMNPADDDCQSVQMTCQKGGVIFRGYLSKEGYNGLSGRVREGNNVVTKNVKDSRITADTTIEFNSSQTNPGFKLYKSACLSSASEMRLNEINPSDNCTPRDGTQANTWGLGETGEVSARTFQGHRCTGDYCVVNMTCLEAPADADDTRNVNAEYFRDVTMVCSCSPTEARTGNVTDLARCRNNEITTMTPFNSFQNRDLRITPDRGVRQ